MTSLASKRFYTYRLLNLILTYSSEFTALTDGKKDKVRMILSCGIIDMNVGSTMRTEIFEIFPSGDIHDDLTTLLSYTPPP